MVTKNKTRVIGAKKEGKLKVGKLKINKETVKDLSRREKKEIKGGLPRLRTITCDEECDSYACMDSYA